MPAKINPLVFTTFPHIYIKHVHYCVGYRLGSSQSGRGKITIGRARLFCALSMALFIAHERTTFCAGITESPQRELDDELNEAVDMVRS